MREKNTKRKGYNYIAPSLTTEELEVILLRIGILIKEKREKLTRKDKFAYEIKISLTTLDKSEAGCDIRLSTFLKVLHGLDISGESFFRALEK